MQQLKISNKEVCDKLVKESDEIQKILATILIKENLIKVSNTISKSSTKESLGTGLINLKQRYQLLSDNLIEVKHTEKEFVLTLPLLTIAD